MKRGLIIAALLLGFLCPAAAFWQSRDSNYNVAIGGAPPAFTGPGDVVSGASAWWGLRAYNAAYATGSNPAAVVCDTATFAVCSTINILANGNFDTATAAGSAACATSCVVKSLTDQTGNGRPAACTAAVNCPTLTFNCIGTLPCMTFVRANSQVLSVSAGFTFTQPATASWVAKRTGTTGSFSGVIGSLSNLFQNGYANAANTGFMGWNNTNATFTMSDNALHAVQLVFSGTSSVANVDNTVTTTTTGTAALGTVGPKIGQFNGNSLDGVFVEGGVWIGTAFTSPQQTSMCHNQFAYWGTAASC